MSATTLCELRGIRKAFSGVLALDGVDLEIRPGEIHALVGENGAGKSTLIRILGGILEPDSGEILIDGRPCIIGSPRAARGLGIALAHQEPEVFPWRSAAENCFNQKGLPGRPWISWRRVQGESREALRRVGADVAPGIPAGLLSASRRQLVALAGALLARPRLLVLDEPTASLSDRESEVLFGIVRELRAAGGAAIYVSHRLQEVLDLSDRITVLRDGRVARSARAGEIDAEGLVEAMVGRKVGAASPRPPEPAGAELLLEVQGLSDLGGAFEDVSFSLRRGEILGLYGLVGAGRTEIGQALAGLRPSRGRIACRGRLAYVPEDRLREGNFPGLSLRENLSIASIREISRRLLVDGGRERAAARSEIERLGIRAAGLEAAIETLSGGNQQKALLGRWLLARPEVLVLDEPTRGIDVGARAEIHGIIGSLALSGAGVILISSDLPEALGWSHRLLVLREGRVAAGFRSSEARPEDVARAAFPLEAPSPTPPARKGRGAPAVHPFGHLAVQRETALAAAIALVLLATGIRSKEFLSPGSFRDMAANSAALAAAALGQTLVIATGAIDISIGSILALSAAAAFFAAGPGGSVPAALAAAVLLGSALGSLNAGLSILGRIHPIIATLGTLGIFRGAFILWTGGDWLSLPAPLLDLASSGPLGVPWTAWSVGIVAAALFSFLRWTRTGRSCLKLGDNPEAAQAHGIRAGATRWLAFAILGALTGLAAVLYTARFGKVQSNTGVGFELQAIAAAVLGGASVSGGKGTVPGALLGAALIGVIQDARSVWGIQERWQLVVVGALLLGAIALENLLSRLSRGGRP